MTLPTPIRMPRPSFWPEPRSPEPWLRALDQLSGVLAGSEGQDLAPRSLWEKYLRRRLSLRSVPGLFGVEGDRLLGAGFLVRDAGHALRLDPATDAVLAPFRRKESDVALTALAERLLKASVPLRLLLIRLARGDWQISPGDQGRAWQVGQRLVTSAHAEPDQWCRGIEADCLGVWAPLFTDADRRGIRPDTTAAAPSHNFGWGPLEAPLYLLDSLGWLSQQGRLSLPEGMCRDGLLAALLPPRPAPADLLRRLTADQADLRGFVPAERVLRDLLEQTETLIAEPQFNRWMDELVRCSLERGAIEVEAAEPGQSRHGRGLFGDRRRQLVRWRVHDGFNEIFTRLAAPDNGTNGETRP
jgi:hypothetical protein